MAKNVKNWKYQKLPMKFYRKKKKGGHASSFERFLGMHFSTKKKTPKMAIERYFDQKKAIEILKNHENLQKTQNNHDFYQKYQKNSKKMKKIRNFSKI
jgi:hypothetical protein